MSLFVDLQVRQALNNHILTIGGAGTVSNERVVDLSLLGMAGVSGIQTLQIAAGEYSTNVMKQSTNWVETFLIKAPQSIKTPSESGLSYKQYQYGLWIKTDKSNGLFTNEAISGLIELHIPNNLHLPIGDQTLTILKTYQQAAVVSDNDTGRLFNRVFVDCEIYYKNNN